jgi:myo-inositol 2-dehydrogenase/D-chiro-inositol 1-dehydrogenase
MNDTKKPSRRDFLKGSAAAVAGASLAGGLSVARNAHAAYADDTIRVALIGCGGRGKGAAVDCLNVPDSVKLVAVADVFEERVVDARNAVKERHPDKLDIPDDRMFIGLDAYRNAIDCGVDLVIMATPPGVRPPQYKAAVEAGKHVFTEKPLCTDAAGFRILMEANKLADQKGLKVGVGLQRHHQPNYQETVKRIRDGAIGQIMFLRCYWNMGNIWTKPRKNGDTELAYQLRNWQYFYYFGGDHITEQHVHNLDVCNWVMNGHPAEANGMGGRQGRDRFPDMGQIYDHHFVEYTFAGGVKMFSQCRQMPDCWNQVAEFAHGTKGEADCAGEIKVGGKTTWKYEGENVNGWAREHVDLLAAIRNGEKYHEGWYGATSSMTSVLGRVASYSGKVVNWDELAERGPAEVPELVSWDQKMPIMPDPDGTYESSVAMPGVWKLL